MLPRRRVDKRKYSNLILCGQFTSKNFVVDSYNNMRLGNMSKGVIKKRKKGNAETDTHRFVSMVRNEIFSNMPSPPQDVSQWLNLVDRCVVALEDLASQNISLMEEHQSASHLMSPFNMFEAIEFSGPSTYANIKEALTKYTDWQKKVRGADGNSYLLCTLDHIDAAVGKPNEYDDDVCGLLKMLRNTRQHSARATEHLFARMVAHNFRELLADFQKAMFDEGYIVRWVLAYSF